MTAIEKQTKSKSTPKILIRGIVCIIVLGIGIVGMSKLVSLKKPPAEAKATEQTLSVETLRAKAANVPVSITAYGEVKALNSVAISAEVAGRVVRVHPQLKTGEIIPSGEVLFAIDPLNYEAALKEAKATTSQWQNTIQRLKKQYTIDLQRHKTLERNMELAKSEFGRIRILYTKDKIGTRSLVDRAEQAFNAASDKVDLMRQTITLYPLRVKEAESSLTSALARLDLAIANKHRCQVRAPFDGRIKSVSLEKDQYVTPGQPLITLADDSVLEIKVPLDSRDARKWLRFKNQAAQSDAFWFSQLEPVVCKIRWTEDLQEEAWDGRLHRVVKFDQQTRTLTVALRIDAANFVPPDKTRLPLVEGMFCIVTIPGKTLANVYRLPRSAVSFENTLFISIDNRLKTRPVRVARTQGQFVYVSEGLVDGDIVITTKLVDPIENALLKITATQSEES